MKHFFTATLLLTSLFVKAQTTVYSAPSQPSTTYYSAPSLSTYTTSPAVEYRSGYTNSNGTYVESYQATQRDNTNLNNFSTQGNVNPYTNQSGTRARDYSPESYNYGQGRTIHEGPRGGQYYNNDRGNKVYVPKRSIW